MRQTLSDVTISRSEYERLLEDRRRIDLIELYKKIPRWRKDATGYALFGTFRQAVDEMERRLKGAEAEVGRGATLSR